MVELPNKRDVLVNIRLIIPLALMGVLTDPSPHRLTQTQDRMQKPWPDDILEGSLDPASWEFRMFSNLLRVEDSQEFGHRTKESM